MLALRAAFQPGCRGCTTPHKGAGSALSAFHSWTLTKRTPVTQPHLCRRFPAQAPRQQRFGATGRTFCGSHPRHATPKSIDDSTGEEQGKASVATHEPSTTPDFNSSESEEEDPALHDGAFGLPQGMARTVFILTSSQFVVTAGFGMIIPILPALSESLGLGASGVGAIVAAPSATRVVLNMYFGALADRVGRKPLMVAGTLTSALGAVGTGLASSLATLIPARVLVGAGSSASMSGSSAYMADLTAKVPHKRAKLLGVQQTMIIGSFVAGPAMGGYLASLYGPHHTFYVVGALTALTSLMYSILPETLEKARLWPWSRKPEAEARPAPDSTAEESPAAAQPGVVETWTKLLKDPDQQAIIAMNSALSLAYTAQLAVVPLAASAVWNASAGEIGLMFSFVSALGLIGAPLGGWAADKFGRKEAVIPAALLTITGLGLLPFASAKVAFLGVLSMVGLGSSMLTPGLTAYAADVAPPEQRAQALSVSRQAGDIIFATAPLGLGMLADFASNNIALGTAAGMAFGLTCAFAARSRRGIPTFRKKSE